MESELKRVERLCDLLADRIKEINVNEDTSNQVDVGILDVARPNYRPVRPEKPRILSIGFVLGLALGVGIAFLMDVMDQRINSVEEVVALLDAPVLGLVPHIEGKEPATIRGRTVALRPTSDVAEAYRTIRTAIYFGATTDIRKLLVTSPAPGDGKTTSASNLAIAMAQAGRRVALIDCDFRRPTQHKTFQLTVTVGFADVFTSNAPIEKAIYPSGIEHLDIVPCGKIPSNPSEILNSHRFIEVLEGLVGKYDLLVIDSPPVAPVTDARILGAICDATMLVLRAEKSTRRISELARSHLVSVGAKIIGVMVNDVSRRRDRYGYYYGYGYGYSNRYYQYGYGPEQGKSRVKTNGDASHGKTNGNGRHSEKTTINS
jgi:capsular exopolysaccharide synthesis family protein